jgi:hypothetical protein
MSSRLHPLQLPGPVKSMNLSNGQRRGLAQKPWMRAEPVKVVYNSHEMWALQSSRPLSALTIDGCESMDEASLFFCQVRSQWKSRTRREREDENDTSSDELLLLPSSNRGDEHIYMREKGKEKG